MKKKRTILDKIMMVCVTGGVLVFGIVAYLVVSIGMQDIDLNNLMHYKPEEATIMYDRDGDIIAEIAKERRIFVNIQDIPKDLKNAFIAAEDRTFYTNPGVDLVGLLRAMLQNIGILLRGNKERYIGASTIAQQVVRNLILTNERTVTRKIKEMIIAYRITAKLPKNRIFEIYLNHIYLGARSYGVATAAKTYFNKELKELSIEECAMLAALPKAPSILDPTKNPKRAVNRRNWVLHRMLDEGSISEKVHQNALNSPLEVERFGENVFGWAFVEYVKQVLHKENISLEDMGVGGYRINTTMHRAWQKIIQEELDNGLESYAKRRGYNGPLGKISIKNDWKAELRNFTDYDSLGRFSKAVVLALCSKDDTEGITVGLTDGSIGYIDIEDMHWILQDATNINDTIHIGDIIPVMHPDKEKPDFYSFGKVPEVNGGVIIMSPKNGEILAMAGCYNDVPATFNRAFQANRQAGSISKPFVYLAALENGISPTDIFVDAELSFNLGGGEAWMPQNHNHQYLGPVTLRMGLENSLNVVTIRVAQSIGLGSIIRVFKRLELSSEYPHNLSITLGSAETTLLNIVRAYAAIANYGIMNKPIAISNIKTTDGYIIDLDEMNIEDDSSDDSTSSWVSTTQKMSVNGKVGQHDSKKICSPQIAYQMISMLKGAAQRKSIAKRTENIDIPFGGKTGTSQHGKDLWFVGITPDIVVGVYVGCDIPEGVGEYGATAALPIFVKIMERIKSDLPDADFKVPDGIRFVKIDRKTGQRTNEPIGLEVIYEVFKDQDMVPEEKVINKTYSNIDSSDQEDGLSEVY